jgi:hypothetical protein
MEYPVCTEREQNTRCFLYKRPSPPQPKKATPGPSVYHISWHPYSVIHHPPSFLPEPHNLKTSTTHNGRRKPPTTSRGANPPHNNVPLRILLAYNSTPRSRNLDYNLRPKLYLDHPPYLTSVCRHNQPLADVSTIQPVTPSNFPFQIPTPRLRSLKYIYPVVVT